MSDNTQGLTEAEKTGLAEFISAEVFGYRDGPYLNHEGMAGQVVREVNRLLAARARGDAATEAIERGRGRAWAVAFLAEWRRPYFGADSRDPVAAVMRAANAALDAAPAPTEATALPLHRTEAGYPNCSTCDGGGCLDCTDPA